MEAPDGPTEGLSGDTADPTPPPGAVNIEGSMTPEIVDPWDVERTLAEVEGLDLADAAELADVAAESVEPPSTALDEASSPRFAATSADPSFSPPLAQRAAACASSRAFADTPGAKTPGANRLATSVVRAASAEAIASEAFEAPASLPSGGAIPATFAESAAGTSLKSPGFFAEDSKSPDLEDRLPLTIESSPASADPADPAAPSESPVWPRSRTLLSASSAAC